MSKAKKNAAPISFEEFQAQAGGRHAVVIRCKKPNNALRKPRKVGDFLDIAIRDAYFWCVRTDYWELTDLTSVPVEAANMNAFLARQKQAEDGTLTKTVKTK